MSAVSASGRIGNLFDALDSSVAAVCRMLHRVDVLVWVDPHSEIVACEARQAPELDVDRIVGAYGVGAQPADVLADLMAHREACVMQQGFEFQTSPHVDAVARSTPRLLADPPCVAPSGQHVIAVGAEYMVASAP